MIHGIGTDILQIDRMNRLWTRWGDTGAKKILSRCEWADFSKSQDKARFLAKRFAAKEAFAKAFGSGFRGAVLLSAISVSHNIAGQPLLSFGGELAKEMQDFTCHLSLSDEKDDVIAFCVIEKKA